MKAFAAFLLALTLAAMPTVSWASPPQGWAHKTGLVQLKRNGATSRQGSAADRLRVMEAFARWGIAYDEGQGDVIASLFTQDAVYSVTEGSATPLVSFRGRAAITESVLKVLHSQKDQRRHAMSNVVIESMDRNSATALAYGIVTIARDDTLTLGASVIYLADLKRERDGVWRFSRFVIGMDKYVGVKPQP